MSRGVPVRITTGIEAQHNRVAFMRAMGVYGEVVYCRKPPYSGIPGEDYVNIGFASQSAAERAYEELKAGRVIVDGIIVGCGQPRGVPVRGADDRGGGRSRSRGRGDDRGKGGGKGYGGKGDGGSRGIFKQRHDERSPSPRTIAREAAAKRSSGGGGGGGRRSSRSRSRSRGRRKRSRSRSGSRRRR
mmetsp:Transcript_95077/g.241658  ORF Transcript_95077/g.241658 Transcript_95077/m.241658 type:complete len:187 (-) Transcript_95077:57-617(-)